MFAKIFRTRRKHKHSPLAQDDSESLDTETLLPSSAPPSDISEPARKSDSSNRDIQIAIRTLLLCTVIYLGAGLWLASSFRHATLVPDADAFCMKHISRYSPVVNEVKPGWHDVQFNGSFLHLNEFRQPAGEEVDAAWVGLGVNYRSVVVPLDEAEETGLRDDQVQVSEEFGGGFPANVEGLHHLHCLDLLRKSLHWNYDYYLAQKKGAFSNSEYIVQIHTTHCLDILRQVLMCTPDVGVLGQVWWQPENESHPQAFVDFNTKHRCRDYEAIRKWAEEHQLPPEEEVDMSKFYKAPGPGAAILPEIP